MTSKHPRLADVAQAFADWRATRPAQGRTPEALRQQAIALLSNHRCRDIIQTLGLSYNCFKAWQRHSEAPATTKAPDFIPLPESAPSDTASADTAFTLKWQCQHPDGNQTSVEGHLTAEQWASILPLLNPSQATKPPSPTSAWTQHTQLGGACSI